MTLLTTTTHTYSTGYGSAGGQREDLSDVIYELFPEDTWAVTNLDKEKANATYTEWLGQSSPRRLRMRSWKATTPVLTP